MENNAASAQPQDKGLKDRAQNIQPLRLKADISENSRRVLEKRYLRKDPAGRAIETP